MTKASDLERPPPWPHPPHRHLGITPPSIGDFRWWDEIFLTLSHPLTSEEATIVHRTKYSCEPPHGVLVPALEELFSRLDEPRFKKSQGSETLKTASISCPQTTHFLQVCRIQQNRPKNCSIPNQGGRKPRRCYRCDCGYPPPHLHPPLSNRHLTLNAEPITTRR